jgi:hypothetical protein
MISPIQGSGRTPATFDIDEFSDASPARSLRPPAEQDLRTTTPQGDGVDPLDGPTKAAGAPGAGLQAAGPLQDGVDAPAKPEEPKGPKATGDANCCPNCGKDKGTCICVDKDSALKAAEALAALMSAPGGPPVSVASVGGGPIGVSAVAPG